MDITTSLIHDTLEDLTSATPQELAQIRQNLYNQLNLPIDKQIALYSSVLGPAGAGKIEDLNVAVETACKIVEMADV